MVKNKKRPLLIALLIIVMSLVYMMPVTKRDAYAASVTAKAKKAYKKKLKAFARKNYDYSYKIKNVYSTRVPELVVFYYPSGERHGVLKVYTYKGKKAKSILSCKADNPELRFYSKSKSLVVSDSYHDYQSWLYFKYTSGKFRLKAKKVRTYDYDIEEYGYWKYYNSKGSAISMSSFKKTVQNLQKGSKKTITP